MGREILLLLAVAAPPSDAQGITTKVYVEANGVPLGNVNRVVQDKFGYIWFASDGGLFRYDGHQFLSETNRSRVVSFAYHQETDTVIAGLTNGEIWFSPVGSITRWNNRMRMLPEREDRHGADVRAILLDRRKVMWTGFDRLGLLRIPFDTLRVITWKNLPRAWTDSMIQQNTVSWLQGQSPRSISEDEDGAIWIGTERGLYVTVDGITPPRRVSPNLRVTSIVSSRKGGMWVGYTGGGARRLVFDGMRARTVESVLTGKNVSAVAEDLDGRTWFGLDEGGVLESTDRTIVTYDDKNGILPGRVNDIMVDVEGNVWIAGIGGVAKIPRFRFQRFNRFRAIDATTLSAACLDSAGRVWFAGRGGIVSIDDSEVREFPTPTSLRNTYVNSITAGDDGRLWIQSDSVVFSFRNGKFFPFSLRDATPTPVVVGIFAKPHRPPMIVLRDMLLEIQGGRLIVRRRFADAVSGAFMDASGVLWLSTQWEIHRVSGEDEDILPIAGSATVFEATNGEIWAGNSNELVLVGGADPADLTRFSAREFTLPTHSMRNCDAFEDPLGRKVLLTENEAFRLDGDRLRLTDRYPMAVRLRPLRMPSHIVLRPWWTLGEPHWYNANTGNMGRSSALSSVAAMFTEDWTWFSRESQVVADRNGRLWTTNREGIVRIEPPSKFPYQPRVYVQRIHVAEGHYAPSANSWWYGRIQFVDRALAESYWNPVHPFFPGGFSQGDTVTISIFNPSITIDCQGISFSDENDVRYSYRLDEKEWSTPTTAHEMPLGTLTTGVHAFSVRMINGEGVPSKDRVLYLRVSDPFWFSPWFLAYGIGAVLYVGTRLVRRRMRNLRDENKKETARAVLDNELRMARNIQMGMLPHQTPSMSGLDIAARSIPASEVGGDFYDFVDLGKRKLGLCIGDVSGHGLTGAMIVGLARTSLRFASTSRSHPADVLSMANARIYADIRRNLFVAVFFGIFDRTRKTLTYTSAGQTPPILCRNGQADFLPYSPGDRLPLGVKPATKYGEKTVHLLKGDTVLFYTDGIVEMRNSHGEDYGFDRLKVALTLNAHRSSTDLLESIQEEIRTFADGQEQQDDITIVILKVTE